MADTRTFTLPDAAQILGAVWRALDLQFPKRRAQSGRKFLRGDRPGNDETRAGMLRDMACAFVDAGYVYITDGECEGVRNCDRAVEEIVAGVNRVHRRALLEPIVHAGAHCEAAHALIDRIATLDGIAAINSGALDDRAATLRMALRACEGMWILGDVVPHAHVPPEPPDVPEEVQRRIVVAMTPGAEPEAFTLAVCSHPASLAWALRLVVQRALFDGSFALVAPAVANVADALGDEGLRFDAVMLYLLARNPGEARRRLEALSGPPAETLRVLLALVDDRASEAIPILASLAADGHSVTLPLAAALAQSGRHADALELARDILDNEPGNALALALAARCAWALGETRAGNAFAKRATRLGRPVERPAARRG